MVLLSQPPYSSQLKYSLEGNARASPNATQKVLHSVGKRQHDFGLREPSGLRVRPPQIPAQGYFLANSRRFWIELGRTTVSGLSSNRYSPRATVAPTLQAGPKPMFFFCSMTFTCGKSLSMEQDEPSTEALSTTIISKSILSVVVSIDRRHSWVRSLQLKLTMMMESDVKIYSQKHREGGLVFSRLVP